MLKHPVTKTPLSLPPLLTRMGVYQQVINVSPPHHSLAPEWNVCPSFPDGQFSFLLPSILYPSLPFPFRVPKGALISHHKDKSMSEKGGKETVLASPKPKPKVAVEGIKQEHQAGYPDIITVTFLKTFILTIKL